MGSMSNNLKVVTLIKDGSSIVGVMVVPLVPMEVPRTYAKTGTIRLSPSIPHIFSRYDFELLMSYAEFACNCSTQDNRVFHTSIGVMPGQNNTFSIISKDGRRNPLSSIQEKQMSYLSEENRKYLSASWKFRKKFWTESRARYKQNISHIKRS